jgi:hydrogenase expression/formation protein HypD
MKYVDEFRKPAFIKSLAENIKRISTKPLNIMEVCGGQTHSIMKYALEDLLPDNIQLLHGPGCPVCVTAMEDIDLAIELSERENTIITAFGDMMRVPGSNSDLLRQKAKGNDVRIVFSPLETISIALQNPDKEIIFFAVGFETTMPAISATIVKANELKLSNLTIIESNVVVPPAIDYIMTSGIAKIDGFLAAGHVCSVMGWWQYEKLAEKFRIPIVVTGFEPADILLGLLSIIEQLEKGTFIVENKYSRAVSKQGNIKAQELISRVFEPYNKQWRGIGEIPSGGMKLKPDYHGFSATNKFSLVNKPSSAKSGCIAGQVLMGVKKPSECEHFGTVCNPENPLGAPMVSSEGACAAYFRFKKYEHTID